MVVKLFVIGRILYFVVLNCRSVVHAHPQVSTGQIIRLLLIGFFCKVAAEIFIFSKCLVHSIFVRKVF